MYIVHGNFKPGANDSMELKKHNFDLTNTQSKCRVMDDHIPIRQCCIEDWKWTKDEYEDQRFFGFWKWTKDEYEESSLIQKFFEDLRRLQILWRSSKLRRFSKENEKFSLLRIFFQAATST